MASPRLENFPAGRGRKDLIVGLLAQAVMTSSTLVMLPFIVTRLEPVQVGVWYLFLTVQALVALMDFGAGQTLTRFFGYVHAGATDLRDNMVPGRTEYGQIDPKLLDSLFRTAQRLYFALALIVAVSLATVGSFALVMLTRDEVLPESIWPSWVVFAAALVIQTGYLWQGPPLIGAHMARRNYVIAARGRLLQVALSVIGLVVLPSLLTLGLAFAISVIVMRIDYYIALRPFREILGSATFRSREYRDLSGVLLRSVRQQGGAVLGVLAANRFMVFAVAWYAGVVASASYSIAYQALVALNSMAFVVQTMVSGRIADARINDDTATLRRLHSAVLASGWGVFILGGATIVTVLPWLLEQIGSSTGLPAMPVIVLMVVIYLLEMNMFMATNMITLLDNDVPYWRALLVGGAATVVVVVTSGELGQGLVAILIAQLLTQVAFNAWYWPRFCNRRLSLQVTDIPELALSMINRKVAGQA